VAQNHLESASASWRHPSFLTSPPNHAVVKSQTDGSSKPGITKAVPLVERPTTHAWRFQHRRRTHALNQKRDEPGINGKNRRVLPASSPSAQHLVATTDRPLASNSPRFREPDHPHDAKQNGTRKPSSPTTQERATSRTGRSPGRRTTSGDAANHLTQPISASGGIADHHPRRPIPRAHPFLGPPSDTRVSKP